MRGSRAGIVLALVTSVFLAVPGVRADVSLRPVSADFDAEFARAADSLEGNGSAEGRTVLEEIRRRAAIVPAWTARVGLLLAADAVRRRDFAGALHELDLAPAAAIGLEPYRQVLFARALEGAGRLPESADAWRAAWETEEPFGMRSYAGRGLAQALARRGASGDAAAVLGLVARLTPAEAVAVAPDRIRLSLAAGNRPSAAAAARDLALSGVDPAGAPPFARALVREQIGMLSPAERGRLGRSLAQGPASARAIRLLRQDPPFAWPAEERAANLLALSRALARGGDAKGAEAAAALVPEDGTLADFDARLLRADIALAAARRRRNGPFTDGDPLLPTARRPFLTLTASPAPVSVRIGARERLIRLAAEVERFDEGLEQARNILADSPGSTVGFEPLWKLAWEKYRAADFRAARQELEALASVYRDAPRERRLLYWRARCLAREGRAAEAVPLFESLASGEPADVYALFARKRVPDYRLRRAAPLPDPSRETAAFRRTDELLRLRFFEGAAAEARLLPPSRGRDLRLAEAEFALGKFAPAAAAVKRAFPEIGTAAEARVPDGWRRLYYPIELGGFLASEARQFRLDPAILRGLVRQESVFDPDARSRAGALGLTQLMPGTAKSLAKSVLRVRYRRAFLYDPSTNARLGAAYLRSLFDRFSDNPLWALAAYNGGPTRMARVLRENPGLPDDEVFESHPAFETRDYVRRVMLFAGSYRELYP
ncbi:MAG: lytic transglycosylase domain-containing protein [Acidobacteria bacterium]|nr:lytic transglycosylase domain-containing protein [Acidobacteriota bacterium]